jgi:hypothetical protein
MGPLGQVFLAVSWIILAIFLVINALMAIF